MKKFKGYLIFRAINKQKTSNDFFPLST